MKLLNPNEVKDLKNQELARDVIRVQEIEKVIKDTNYRLAKSQADFSSMLADHKEKWAKEESEHNKRVIEMESEIQELESKRKQALIPIEVEKNQAYNLMKEAKDALAIVYEKQERLDETQEILENRLTDVADRELSVISRESALQGHIEGIKVQSEQVRQGSLALSEEMTKFQEYRQEEEKKLNERKREASLAEINLIAQKKKIERDLEAIRVEKIKLKDMRETLERALARK